MNQTAVKKRVVGVDISLDATTYAIVDVRGNILAKDSFPTEDYPEINGYVKNLCEKIIELVEQNGGYESIRSVGISAPSGNYITGCIVNSPNMPWKGVIPLSGRGFGQQFACGGVGGACFWVSSRHARLYCRDYGFGTRKLHFQRR